MVYLWPTSPLAMPTQTMHTWSSIVICGMDTNGGDLGAVPEKVAFAGN